MALVPTANPESIVEPTDQPATARAEDYQRLSPPADINPIPSALANFGNAAIQTGDEFKRSALAVAGLNNETAARNQSTKTMGDMATQFADFASKKGENATAAYKPFMDNLAQMQQQAMASMGNPQATNMLGNALAPLMRHYTEAAAMHLKTETVNSSINSSVARIDALGDQAALFSSDTSKVDTYIAGIRGEMHNLGQIQGWDADTLNDKTTKAISATYQKVIESLAIDKPLVAQAMFDRVRDQLNAPDALRINEFLKPKVDKAGDEAWLQSQIGGNHTVPPTTDFDKMWAFKRWQESRGNQTDAQGQPLMSSAGAVGISQIKPETAQWTANKVGIPFDEHRLETDPAYNEALGKAHFKLMLQQYGDPTLAAAAYAGGMGNVNKWISSIGDPRTGQISTAQWAAQIPNDEVRKSTLAWMAGVGVPTGSGAPQRPDRSSLLEAAANSSGDIDTQLRRLTMASRYTTLLDHATAQDKADLTHDIEANIGPALHDGVDGVAIPETKIRSLFPPEQAERTIANLKYLQLSGDLFKTVALASPDELNQMRQDLTSGQGIVSNMLKGKGALLIGTGANGAPIGADSPMGRQADFKLRAQMAQELETRIEQRNAALRTDPAAYVATNDPKVRASLAAMQQGDDPNALQTYATATLASQERLGVAAGHEQMLPLSYIDSMAGKFKTDDPSTTDPGKAIQSLADQWKGYWPRVYGELVTKGKLPDEFAVTAVLDAPGQAQVRQDYVRAWQAAGKKGEAKLEEAIDPAAKAAINKDIDTRLSDLRSTILVPGVSAAQNVDTYTQFRNGVRLLASYYVLNGTTDGDQALQKAVDGMIGLKWDLGGTYRTPKGQISQVENAMQQTERGLTVANVRDPGAIPGSKEAALDPDKRTELWLGGKKLWVNNDAGDGVVMRVQAYDGSVMPIYTKDGKRVELKFSDISRTPIASVAQPSASEAVNGAAPF